MSFDSDSLFLTLLKIFFHFISWVKLQCRAEKAASIQSSSSYFLGASVIIEIYSGADYPVRVGEGIGKRGVPLLQRAYSQRQERKKHGVWFQEMLRCWKSAPNNLRSW